MKFIFPTFWIIVFLFTQVSYGIQNPPFNHLSSNDGLSNPVIHSIFQDMDGFIWFGTDKGLNRYDGYTFKTYYNNPTDSISIGNSTVYCIEKDHNGDLWLGTAYGISVYSRDTDKFKPIILDGTSQLNFIRAIHISSDSAIWLGSNEGLVKYNPELGTYKRFVSDMDSNTSLSHNIIRAIAQDDDGYIWIGTYDGLNRFDPELGTFQQFKLMDRKENDPINNLIISLHHGEDPNTLWVGTQTGLVKFDLSTHDFKLFRKELGYEGMINNTIKTIAGPFDHQLWMGTDEGLLIMDVDEEVFEAYRHNPYKYNSLANDVVINIYTDRSGILWLGTNDGLSYLNLNRKQFDFHPIVKLDPFGGATGGEVYTVLKQENADTWIGGSSGLTRIDKEGRQHWYYAEMNTGLASNKISDLYLDQAQNVWICTSWGLNLYNPNKDNFLYFDIQQDPRVSSYVSSIVEYEAGKYIVGSSGKGLLKFELSASNLLKGKGRKPDYYFLKDITVNDMVKGAPNEIWIASHGGEVYKYLVNEDAFELYHLRNQSLENEVFIVNCLYYDGKNQMWAGTRNGAYKLNTQSGYFEWVSEIGNVEILAIAEETSPGKLWLSSSNSLIEMSDDERIAKRYMVGTDLSIKGFTTRSAFGEKDGALFFGGIDGFISFNPKDIHIDHYIPKTLVTSINIDNTVVVPGLVINGRTITDKSIHLIEELGLKYNENSLRFSFSNFHFASPKSSQFAYYLENFDKEWRYTDGSQAYALYSNLKPGEYTFKVKGANPDQVWNEVTSTVKIVIDQPWWATSFAFISYFLLMMTVGILAARQTIARNRLKNELRFEQLHYERNEELNQLKMKFFTNISHEIRTPLTLILGPVDQLIHRFTDKKVVGQLNMMKRNATRLLRLVNQIMDMRKLEKGKLELSLQNGDLVAMAEDIYAHFGELARIEQIDYSFSTRLQELHCQFDTDKIDKILFNLISNAFKFSEKDGQVAVELNYPIEDKEYIEIAIRDSGKGITEEQIEHIFERFYQSESNKNKTQSGTGIGLSMSYDYAKLHGGIIRVESKPGKGSIFRLLIPMILVDADTSVAGHIEENQLVDWQGIVPVPIEVDAAGEGTNQELPLVLIVEDNHDMRQFICDNLAVQFQLLEAENGLQGFEMARKHNPQLIISDIMMPVMDGLELCKKIKSEFDTSHIPVILLTAKNSPENVLKGLEEGADDYVTKPFFMKQLLARTENLISSRKLLIEKFNKGSLFNLSDIAISGLDEKFLSAIVDVIENHITDPELNIVFLAKSMGMSHSAIYKKIKAISGLSGNEFIRNIRLKRAIQLLKTPGINISEVVYQVGFNNRSYFSKCFQDTFDMTPTQFVASLPV